MTERRHSDGLAERWHTLTVAEQLGNIGSEVSRTLKWRSRNPPLSEGALHRALELIDLTLDDPRNRVSVARLREICRVREVLLDYLVGANQYGETETSLQRYFDIFAIAVANARGRT